MFTIPISEVPMAGRKRNGAGSVRKRADGRWEARVRYQDPQTGMNKRDSVYGASAREVREKLTEVNERIETQAPPKNAHLTVGGWAREWSMNPLEASSRRESTKALYRSLVNKHIVGTRLSKVTLNKLRPSHIDDWILELRGTGLQARSEAAKGTKGRTLAESTIARAYQVLRVILSDAVRDELMARNPMELTKQPKFDRVEARFLSIEEAKRILAAAKGTRFASLLTLIAATGLRKGEASALRWSDVDYGTGALHIRGTLSRLGGELVVTPTKTRSSRRQVYPAAGVFNLLREQQEAQQLEHQRAGNGWCEGDFVFTTDTGRPHDPRNVLRAIQTAAKKAGVENVTVHTLRHTAATIMLEQGVHLKAVSQILGHASIQITADTYGHVSPEAARGAVGGLGESLGF